MITERLMDPGSWGIKFSKDVPRDVVDALEPMGHIVVTEARVDPASFGSTNLISASRYTGVITDRSLYGVSGLGMEWWLGDNDGKGIVFETVRAYSALDIADFINMAGSPYGIIRDNAGATAAITAGSISADATTKSAEFLYTTQREALGETMELFGMEYRVNHDGTLDVDTQANLFTTTTPTALFLDSEGGDDINIEGFQLVDPDWKQSARELTSRVALVDKTGTLTGVNAGSFPYKDIHGNTAVRTKLVTKEVRNANASAHATRELNKTQRAGKRDLVTLNLDRFEVRGAWRVGDTVYVFAPLQGLYNLSNEALFRGQHAYPATKRVFSHKWGIREGMGVYHRDKDGNVTDLTDYVLYDTGGEVIEIGARRRSLQRDSKLVSRPELVAVRKSVGAIAYKDDAGVVNIIDDDGDDRIRIMTGGNLNLLKDDGSTIFFQWDESADWIEIGEGAASAVNLRLPDGSASVCPINNWNHLDTGIFFPGNDEVGISIAGTETARVDADGIKTDYSANALPRGFYTFVGDHTFTGTGAYATVTTGPHLNIDLGTATISATLTATAYWENTGATNTGGRFRVRYSLDGGSTWNNTTNVWSYGIQSGNSHTREATAIVGGITNQALTGNLQVEVQGYVTNTDLTLQNAAVHINVYGDI